MSADRRRHYLDALEIPLWLPRRPLAIHPHAASATPDPSFPTAEEMAVNAETERANVEPPPADDGWTPPMDDDWELLADTEAVDPPSAAPTAADRATRIARLGWTELEEEVRQCTACGLCASRTQTVFGVGDRQADWLIVGEAPGADEDRQGEPFVGRAGKLLNPMLQAIGLKREQVYIANILKCRPPENRDPAPAEAASCRPFLERQIALIRPRIIFAVGRIAAQNLLDTDAQIGKLRGRVHRLGPARIPLVVTYHPAYLLRSPREKRKSWDDLRLARRALAPASTPST